MSRRRPRGVAMAVVLMVLSLAVVIVVAIGTLGVQHLNQANAALYTRISLYAAEAGVAEALMELAADNRWTAGFNNVSYNAATGARYSVQVTNNLRGSSTLTAPDGTTVPVRRAYMVSTGTCRNGSYPRKIEVVVSSPPEFIYALASGGDIELGANTTVTGNVKASSDIQSDSTLVVLPANGRGRVLAGGEIRNNVMTVDPTQDVRAREAITGIGSIGPTTLITQNDTSSDTAEFLNDGQSYYSKPSADGEVMPNPDVSRLLSPGGYVDHTGVTASSGVFDLAGKIHYFPDGITFANNTRFQGSGTIVVGNGHDAIFAGGVGSLGNPVQVNVVALDGNDGQTGGNRIVFQSATYIQGLVYSHGSVEAQGALKVEGSVIAYGNGDLSHTGSAATFTWAPIQSPLPGFESFFDTGLDRPVITLSWQRL